MTVLPSSVDDARPLTHACSTALRPSRRAALAFALCGVATLHGCATRRATVGVGADVKDRLIRAPLTQPTSPALVGALHERSSDLVFGALTFTDTRYQWGGKTPSEGFDCSGLTRYVYGQVFDWQLPRQAAAQAASDRLIAIEPESLGAGDLVFFNTLGREHSHVGIYVGDGKFVHAPRTGAHVRVERLQAPYWASRFTGARRHPPAPGTTARMALSR